ncbi:response regulator transcription factor [Cellulosilyticum sp. I15G10I2]|uniref:response regulator transcription factor n=1 Tax=Cellulosilyticum sp. I15G10I2 TaxID=1892843 RepID=UPI00085CC1FD|nr:response regulator [Cellulosilyticum sp. I15G10I2]
MLKLIIVDDEKVIRETIKNLIDWKSIGIHVVGVCKDGLEAYDMIQDENPDIVMTDIKMPGIMGLELIEKAKAVNSDIEFIILSGYGEFNFAAQAMRNGVQHYLLKPCNEKDIISVISEVKDKCYQKRALKEQQDSLLYNFKKNVLRNTVTECLATPDMLDSLITAYEKFLDFSNTPYHLFHVFYLEEKDLLDFLKDLYAFETRCTPGICLSPVYVKNTLSLFFEDFQKNYDELNNFILSWQKNNVTALVAEQITYPNLRALLSDLLPKIARYDTIYTLNRFQMIPTYNYNALLHSVNSIAENLTSGDLHKHQLGSLETEKLLNPIEDIEFLKTMISSFLFQSPLASASQVTEFLVKMNSCTIPSKLKDYFYQELDAFFPKDIAVHHYKDFIQKTIQCVEENLSNPDLSLKWIVDNYLFMNVDYVSKQFVKETGLKFSNYLNKIRIERAKQQLLQKGSNKMYSIANEIGCGNNPQYFSQFFKKHTGMTPTAYVKKMNTTLQV